ncbi:MAG: sulfatase-like hydrolase/transferase [Kiritimatiellae bacterium]|nr:sulfatase-like hydrolase/transferase [Kiritimatiellia bacterium]
MSRPNVVFIMADQHRWDFVGYGANGFTATPHLDRLATRGVAFDAAHCTSPLCCPSRAAVASGRYGMNSGCFTNLHALPPGAPGFVPQLRAAGYHTCAVGKTHMEIHAYDSDLTSTRHRAYMDSLGWDEVCEISGNGMLKSGIVCAYSEFLKAHGQFDAVLAFYRQWHYFMDRENRGTVPGFGAAEWPLAEAYQETPFVGNRAVEWLRSRARAQPFFLHVGFAAPHSPIEPYPAYMDLYRDKPEPEPWGDAERPPHLADGRRGYRAMISHIDNYVGQICSELEAQGILDHTIVLYTADHGEMAGDHGRTGKTCFFDGAMRVPLIVSGPGITPQARSGALVELIDLGRTVNELCGVAPHGLDQGKSLVPLLRGETAVHRDTLYAEMGCDKMIRDARYKLMWGDPKEDTRPLGRLHLDKPVNVPASPPRLYDLLEDPHERNNLVADPRLRGLKTAMQEKLLARINENTQTRPFLSRGEYRPL